MSRNSTWTVRDFEQCEEGVKRAWDALATDSDRIAYARRAMQAAGELDEASVLKAIVLGIMTLELHGTSGVLNAPDAKRLKDDTWLLLRSNGVMPSSSRLSFLYGRILRAEGAALYRKGQLLPATARHEVAAFLTYRPKDEPSSLDLVTTAKFQLRLGHASLAIASASAALTLNAEGPAAHDARLVKHQALRLSRADEALKEFARAIRLDERPEAHWELVASQLADPAQMAAAAARVFRGREVPMTHLLATKLWLHASKSRTARQTAPKTSSLRRRTLATGASEVGTKSLLRAAQTFDEAYDDAIPLHVRLSDVADLCGDLTTLPDVESELLALAAATRHARHYGQGELAKLYFAEYQALCARLTDGQRRDLLDLTKVSEVAVAERTLSGIARATKLASAVGEAVGISVSSRVRRRLAGEEERERLAQQEVVQLGEALVRHLSELKGGLMKVGQFLSTIDGLPVEIKAMLALLRHSAEPMAPLTARAELTRAFGDPSEVFAEFAEHPFAVGSIAQLHRAVLKHSGEPVAVKIQHPGVKESIGSDLRFLGLLKPFLARMLPVVDLNGMLKELGARLREETDFRREAAVQESFRLAFAGDKQVVIPRIHAQWSNDHVLTMDLVEGRRYDDFVQEASADEKSAAGVVIAKTFCQALFGGGMFNCDPHPGNFLFLPDGRVAFLDFGCSRQWDVSFVRMVLQEPFEHTLRGDFPEFCTLLSRLGYNQSSGKFNFEAHWQLCKAYYAPLLTPGKHRFDQAYLGLVNDLHVASPNLKTASPPPEALMLLRITFGLMNVLVELGAEADWHAMATEALQVQNRLPISQPA